MTAPEWISVTEFAERVGKTRQYINKLIRSGKIQKSALRPKGKGRVINPALAIEQMESNISYVNKKPVKQSGTETKRNRNGNQKRN